MTANLPSPRLAAAVEAALEKSADNVVVLDLREMGAFTDYFLVCTAWSSPQMQAIADEIDRRVMAAGLRRGYREGYDKAEWVLLDFGEFVVHIFNEKTRSYFDLERLWRAARRIEISGPTTAPTTAG